MTSVATTTDRLPRRQRADNLRHFWLGVALALLWVGATFPDLVATYVGNRPTNDVSFTPAWLKAARDVSTMLMVLVVCRKSSRGARPARVLAVLGALFYAVFGISQGNDAAVCVRGVLWLFALVWPWTAQPSATPRLRQIAHGAMIVFIPAGVVSSLALGLGGADMYFEWIGPYQRNPGLFLSPSATAFVACAACLMVMRRHKILGWASLAMGALSVSGIFYLNVGLLFGRLPKLVYVALAVALAAGLAVLGVDGVIALAAESSGGLREGGSVNETLGARALIIANAVSNFTWLGNYPLGLNVAASNSTGVEQFFPDNAYLAAAYAFGVVGIATSLFVTFYAARKRDWGVFLLLLTSGMFYVWFENSLTAFLVGCLLNRHFADGVRKRRTAHHG